MKRFLLKHWLLIAGAFIGAIGGYLYYAFVGCVSGTCPITSNPYLSIFYGTLMGYLFFGLFQKSPKTITVEQEVDKNKTEE